MRLEKDALIAESHDGLRRNTLELFLSCRTGDLARVKYLVEEQESELNVRDRWDGTPLYYACLCGHKDVVEYLLSQGASCVANTFDGERCLYASLSLEIRDLLRDRKVITSNTMRRDTYDEFLRRCLEDSQHCDVSFSVQGEIIPAHRCVLAARCDFFRSSLLDKWAGRQLIPVTHHAVDGAVFRIITQYLYTGRLEMQAKHFESFLELASRCQLISLIADVKEALAEVLNQGSQRSGVSAESETILLEPTHYREQLQRDFSTLPVELASGVTAGGAAFPAEEHNHADICINVDGTHFLCHKVFLCNRSEYFRALIEDHFTEASRLGSDQQQLPVIELQQVTPNIFGCVLRHVYSNSDDRVNATNVWDVLCAADVYLLPDLKRQCGAQIARLLDVESICGTLRASRLFRLPRLENQCIEFMAKHLAEVIELPEFHEAIREDAKEVKLRSFLKTHFYYYFYPFYHAVCYFTGCITFFAVASFKRSKMPKVLQATAWCIAVACGMCCIFIKTVWYRTRDPTTEFGKLSAAFFDRILWSIFLAWITLSCATGRGGFLNKFLSWSAFTPLSRLAFGVYIIHLPFIHLCLHISRERIFFSHFSVVSFFFSMLVWSYLLSYLLFIFCEAPTGRLDKLIFDPQRRKTEGREKDEAPNDNSVQDKLPDAVVTFRDRKLDIWQTSSEKNTSNGILPGNCSRTSCHL
ncbi:ankyrin repeat and BTB/POZ domain-containing protein 1-like isoform X1 [Amblyomma americanum]